MKTSFHFIVCLLIVLIVLIACQVDDDESAVDSAFLEMKELQREEELLEEYSREEEKDSIKMATSDEDSERSSLLGKASQRFDRATFGQDSMRQRGSIANSKIPKSYRSSSQSKESASTATTSARSAVGASRTNTVAAANEDLVSRLEAKKLERESRISQESARILAFRLPRRVARPVEKMLQECPESGSRRQDWFARVLDLGRDRSEFAVRQAYRMKSLAVHPDKNVHPEAKVAFDCLQEAYATALATAQRSESLATDASWSGVQGIRKEFSALSRRMQVHSMHLKLKLQSVRARVSLFLYRLAAGAWREEVRGLVWDPVRLAADTWTEFQLRLTYAPTRQDKLLILWEVLHDNFSWRQVLLSGVVLTLMWRV